MSKGINPKQRRSRGLNLRALRREGQEGEALLTAGRKGEGTDQHHRPEAKTLEQTPPAWVDHLTPWAEEYFWRIGSKMD